MTTPSNFLTDAFARLKHKGTEEEPKPKPAPSFDGGAKAQSASSRPVPSMNALFRAHLNARHRVESEDFDPDDAAA